MKKTILTLAAVLWASFAYAQGPTPPVGIVIGTPVIGTCTNGYGISNNSGVIGCTAFGTGTGTVTSIGIGTGLSSTQSPLTTTGTLSVNFGTTSGTAAQGGVITAGGPTGSSSVIPVITWNAAGQLTAVSTASISVPTSANPSATIGLTAVNGTAGTFMTSDSAPALSQSIAPTWSNTHTFSSDNSSER